MNEWISVEERLPAQYELVDVWDAANSDRIPDAQYLDGGFYGTGFYARDYAMGRKPIPHITHWMPLPEAPKEEKT